MGEHPGHVGVCGRKQGRIPILFGGREKAVQTIKLAERLALSGNFDHCVVRWFARSVAVTFRSHQLTVYCELVAFAADKDRRSETSEN